MEKLHWMTAGLFLAAGAEAAFGQRRGDYRPSEALRWAPLIAAPLAVAAQAARALSRNDTTRLASQVANTLAITVGAAGLVNSIGAARRLHQYEVDREPSLAEMVPSLAPLAFGAVGVLGLLLEGEEGATRLEEEMPPPRRRKRRRHALRIRV